MTNELAVTQNENPYAIMPVLTVQFAAERRQAVIDYTKRMMVRGVDYGVIPGTGDKPTLLKPGAEKLASMFGLRPDFDPIETITDWTGENHGGEPFFFIRYRCTLYRGDLAVGQGVGSCNSWEKKYRYRNVYPNRATAEDKERGRLENRPGKGGSTYQVYVIKNQDPADVVNTIDKMSQKRALVAAVLIAVNASEMFTQDIEDYSDVIDGDWTPATTQAQPAALSMPQAQPAPAKPQPPQVTPPSTNGNKLYANGVVVRPEKLADYKAYCEAHGGDVPDAPKHLDNWIAKRDAQPAEQSALVTDDPDAVKAASDTAAGLFDGGKQPKRPTVSPAEYKEMEQDRIYSDR